MSQRELWIWDGTYWPTGPEHYAGQPRLGGIVRRGNETGIPFTTFEAAVRQARRSTQSG